MGVADGVNKAAASLKGGVKLNVKAPSVKVKAGAKVTPKAKVTVKAGAAKKRRLQAAEKPADKPAEKPAEKKDAEPVATNMELSKDGLPVSDYSGDVELPNPQTLTGAEDQHAPNSANLV